ncbi:hypothetical protein skT53_18780 [Effusibacillus dendaii]|uniref:histidine kinase n=1 Tax=Effusibacillus dendaii TaxID=2743772 RepID=A0A7I8D9P9_9BACL|nr:hypothetical protein skT53_18780 [Effusibacillus dendaii]
MFTMTRIINSVFDLNEILQVLVDAIASEIAGADLVGFFKKEEDGVFYGTIGNSAKVNIQELYIDPEKDEFVRDIIREQRLSYIPDTTVDRRPDQRKIEIMQIKSILGLPVIVDDKVYGLVFVHDFGKKMNLTQEQIDIVEAFVNMSSVAIRNILMFERTQSLLSKQQLLLEASNAMSKSLSINDVLHACTRYVGQALRSNDIAIHLFNEKNGTFKPYHIAKNGNVTEDEWREKHRTSVSIHVDDDLLFREIAITKKAISIDDVFSDPRPNHQACELFGIKSLLIIPLVAKGKVFGAIAAPSFHKRSYQEDEIELCQSLCDMTGTALSNAMYAEGLDQLVKEQTAELQQANLKLEEYVKELQHLDRLKSDFISSLSHELRTPFTAIKGAIDILNRGIFGELNEQQMELTEMADKALERLLGQVTELLDFSKIENGTFELGLEKANFIEIINDSVQLIEPLTKKKNQKLFTQFDSDIEVCVDKQRMQQVLINLLSNASKFTPPDGEILIKSYIERDQLFIEIKDTGIGIPKDKQKHIFTKFYQVNNVVPGTGLGLSITKQLVELHGGTIRFESEPGKGTVFIIQIPTDGGLENEID